MVRASQLKDVRILSCFTEPELEQVASLGQPKSFEAHSNIIIEGECHWGLFLILDGIVGIYKTNKANGDFYEVAQLRQGQQFGEISLIDDGPRSATVKALVDTNLVYISKEAFQSFLATSMEMRVRFYQNCAKELAVRLRNLDEHYVVSQYQLWKTMLQAPKEAA